MIRNFWRHQRVASLIFVVASLAAAFFAVRLVAAWIYWSDPTHRDAAIEGWMTPGYVAQSWDVPREVVKIVVSHHHFLPAPDFERDQTMPKAQRALDMFVRLGVDMILGGHLHRAYIGNSLDVYAGADREHGIIIAQCGTTTSRRGRGREREKNSFNLIDVEQELLHVTHYLYFDDARGFAPVSRHSFPRPGAGTHSAFGAEARRKER